MGIYRELALLIAGIFLSILFELLLQPILHHRCILIPTILLLFFLLGFGLSVDKWVRQHWHRMWRRRQLKVGRLNDMEWNPENKETYTYTNIGPEDWKKELEKLGGKRCKVEFIYIKKNFDPYTVIINPYGEVYPEHNVGKLESLTKVLSYVNSGGIFINISGIPFYYAFSLALKRRVDLALRESPHAYKAYGDVLIPEFKYPLFTSTPLTKELDLMIFNLERGTGAFNWDLKPSNEFKEIFPEIKGTKVHRAARVEKNVKPVVDSQVYLKGIPFREGSVTPIFYLISGEGSFLFSLIFLDQQPKDVQDKLKQSICKLILNYKLIEEKKRLI